LVVAAVSTISLNVWAQSGNQGSNQSGNPAAAPASAAAPPKSVAPPPADLEPGVNTSATQSSSLEPEPAAAPARAPAPRPATTAAKRAAPSSSSPSAGAGGASNAEPAGTPAAAASKPGHATTAATPKGAGKAHDSLELDTTQITGNRELPKVLYIVPWKRSDLGDLVGNPVNILLDEVLTPVDRDVFKRQNRYYDALKPDDAKDAAGAASDPANGKH